MALRSVRWWQGQRRAMRSVLIGAFALVLALGSVALAVTRLAHQVPAAAKTNPIASPTPSAPPTQAPEPPRLVGSVPGCAPIEAPAPISASVYPRVVIPSQKINVPLYDGKVDSKGVVTVPDGIWVAWVYPGLSHPGEVGNSYIYAHAHGSPPGSAPGLFWNLHYMHDCDVVEVYTDATTAMVYQVTNVNLNWPGRDVSILNQTSDERLTLQTCNDWSPGGPKTIVTALRVQTGNAKPARGNRA